MYKGEVLIPEDQLGSFCQTAVSLKIKGITIDRLEIKRNIKCNLKFFFK